MSDAPSAAEPLLSTFAGDPHMRELVAYYVGELPKRLAELQVHVAANDLPAAAAVAHQVKGSAGGYGFPAVSDAAEALERSLQPAAAPDGAGPQLAAFAALVARVRG